MKISPKQYAQALFELTEGKSEQEVIATIERFALELKKNGHLKQFKSIAHKFAQLSNAAEGIIEAEVVAARELDAGEIGAIADFVKAKYTAREAVVRATVDEKVHGGLVVRVGDEVIDGTVAHKLERLKSILSK